MKEKSIMKGRYLIEGRDAVTGELAKVWRFDNLLTAINQNMRMDMLLGNVAAYKLTDLEIKYFAFGDGTAPVTITDTKLGNELVRKPVTKLSRLSPSIVQSIVNLSPSEANFVIREIGVFCGTTATTNVDTGIMISRVNVNIDKNSSLSLNIVRSDICEINY